MTYQQHRVGLNTSSAALIVLGFSSFGVDIPNGVAVAIVGLAGIITTRFSPGWAGRHGLKAYPAGITAALTTIVAWALPAVGVELDQTQLIALVGAVTLVVSLVTPADDDELDRERVGL